MARDAHGNDEDLRSQLLRVQLLGLFLSIPAMLGVVHLFGADGSGPVDLGRVELPAPGLAQFHAGDGVLPSDPARHEIELVALRPDLDVRAELAPFPLDKPLQLPAGDYVLLFRAEDGGVRSRRFSVRVGERTDVRLDG